ncbi:MAG: acyl-CoA thioesterase [Clostridia bacterium]
MSENQAQQTIPESKRPQDSEIFMTELVLPNDTNMLGNLMGGRMLHWMDISGALAASKHAQKVVATVNINTVDFRHPVRMGEMVELHARLIKVGTTSMDVKVTVVSENLKTASKIKTNEAYLTYVALDDDQRPTPVPKLILDHVPEK